MNNQLSLLQFPGICSMGLGSTIPAKVIGNIAMANRQMPEGFWDAMVNKGLLGSNVIFKK